MFKNFWGGTSARVAIEGRLLELSSQIRPAEQLSLHRFLTFGRRICPWIKTVHWLAFVLATLGCAGCAALSGHIPPADLKEPGWTVHQGQAVWHIPKGGREIAGEVLVATRSEGRAFVQFTKSPFPIVIAQATRESWEIEFPPQNKHYSGRGAPPKRIIWLYLPRVLAGKAPPREWSWKEDSSGWRLENHSNGEVVEGYFEQ